MVLILKWENDLEEKRFQKVKVKSCHKKSFVSRSRSLYIR